MLLLPWVYFLTPTIALRTTLQLPNFQNYNWKYQNVATKCVTKKVQVCSKINYQWIFVNEKLLGCCSLTQSKDKLSNLMYIYNLILGFYASVSAINFTSCRKFMTTFLCCSSLSVHSCWGLQLPGRKLLKLVTCTCNLLFEPTLLPTNKQQGCLTEIGSA